MYKFCLRVYLVVYLTQYSFIGNQLIDYEFMIHNRKSIIEPVIGNTTRICKSYKDIDDDFNLSVILHVFKYAITKFHASARYNVMARLRLR